MRFKTLLEHPLTPWLPSLVVLVGLAAAAASPALVPHGLLPRPPETLALVLIATLAALHRPFGQAGGGTLGIAALILPAALETLGPLPAALVAGLAFWLADTWRGLASRRHAAAMRDAGWLAASLERTAAITGATLLAGAAQNAASSAKGLLALLPAGVYLLALFLFTVLVAALRQRPPLELLRSKDVRRLRPFLEPLTLDAAGWAVGTVFVDAARVAGWGRLGILMAALALVAAEAARGAFRLAAAELRLADLERLQHAHQRILAEISGMGEIAQQVLTECRNVLPVQWFQFEQPQADGSSRSWSAGPDGVLVEGEPRPEPRPPTLPGVHRRASWRIVEERLEVEGETMAVVRLWCDPRRIEVGAEELFATLVPQMASSVHRARLDREAKLDPLTGVPVRRVLDSRLQRAYRLCCEEGSSMAVILCDIDHFKKINDTWGHDAGDQALRVFARTLDSHRRENDLCCRYGGEEFTLLLENTAGEAALRLAERLRRAVEALEFEYEGQRIPLTFSAGVAAFPELHIKTGSELQLLADEALYEAKEQGRNRCLLNLGRGAFRAPAGRTVKARRDGAPEEPVKEVPPRFFG